MRRRFARGQSWRAAALAGLAFGLAGAGLVSCDKMPLSAPTESTITLYAGSTTVGLNGSIEIIATVFESSGTPVQNGTVVTFTTTLGTIEPLEARTNNGKATVKLLAGTSSGTAEVRAFSGGTSSGEALKITVGAAGAGKVELLANPSGLPSSGGVSQLTAIVSDTNGNRLSGIPVSFITDVGVLSQSSVTTDGNGEARTSLTTTSAAKVTASVVGGTGGSGLSASLSIPVRVGPTISISAPAGSLVPGVAATFSVSITAGGSAVRSASIDFGDGASQALSPTGTTTATHVYTKSGTYIITAAATDTAGDSTTATSSVSVQPVVVTVSLSVLPLTITTSAPAEFSASATTTPAGATIERYEWDFGDGSIRTTSSSTTSHLYAAGGGRRYVVTVRAITTSGASGVAQREIVVQ
jgi:PKD repeat protein